jgi:hypothetical protein
VGTALETLSGSGSTSLDCRVDCDSFILDTGRAVSLALLVNKL